MMATEATVTKPVDVPPTESLASHAAYIDSDTHNATSPSPPVNGSLDEAENKQITDLVDELVQSAEVSVSGGSDTEASRSKLDDKNHVRNSSAAKKPQSFKSVSVNRTFLASKGAAATTSRPDSAAGSASSTPTPGNASSSASKLKLVSKSQSGIGAGNKAGGTNGKPGAPSASSVWNKNQPVPTPEPKKMTDEELQLKYGIHLADRLGPDKDGGQSNWADIDDDEEWDPDTITWTDGTHIKLPQAEEKAPSPIPKTVIPAPIAAPLLTKQHEVPPKTRSPAPPTSNISSPSIKPGVLASGKGLVLKGAPEKPVLVAKPPAQPTPTKSPWAPLPPIDKAAPIMLDAQVSASQHQGYQRPPARTPPPPTKEIAADDFSRGPWRDGPNANISRELFNSHSGRYEPVHDRRGSRNDGYGRQPAVLQRPSHHEAQGPAEPSAAFQTSRNSAAEGPYGRRRGSSNVSGGSGNLAYHLDRPLHGMPGLGDPQHVRSGSMSGSQHPFSPQGTPRTQHGQMWQPRASPSLNQATVHHDHHQNEPMGPPPLPQAPVEDEIEVQKRLMRERREAAIKRRQEDEAREEEARKERIRKKLEAMGPPPERKSMKKEDKEMPSPTAKDAVPAALLARTKPVADEPVTEPASTSNKRRKDSSASAAPDSSIQANGAHAVDLPPLDKSDTDPLPPTAVPKAQSTAPWPDAPQSSDRYPPWAGGHQTAPRNVWAAPGNDRSLGNGTFHAELSHSIPGPHQPTNPNIAHRPAPIGPPRPASKGQPVAPAGSADVSSSRPAPIGPPRGNRAQPQQPQRQQASTNLWQNYDATADDQALREEKMAQEEARMKRRAEQGTNAETAGPAISETWRSVQVDRDGRRTQAGNSMYVHGGMPAGTPDMGRSGQSVPVGPAASANGPRGGSRFFPPTRDARLDELPMQYMRPSSPTPPPPTMDDHPAYSGNPTRPHVSLPRGPIVVKLPPAAAKQLPPAAPLKPAAPVSFAAAAAAAPPRPAAQLNVARNAVQGHPKTQANWQDKINSLMGKKSLSRVMVDATSRTSMEHGSHSANVSLPSLSSASSVFSDDSTYTSREMAEECFEEQEMGSLPAVHLPSKIPDAMYHAVEPNWMPLVPKFRVHATNAEPHRFSYDYQNGKSVIRVSAPGMQEVKTVLFNFQPSRSGLSSRTRSNPRRGPGARGGSRHPSRGGGQRGGRDGPSEGPIAGTSSDRPQAPRGGRGGRGGYRSDVWGRQGSSAPISQN